MEGEKTIKGGYTGKGIRVDVYVMDEELSTTAQAEEIDSDFVKALSERVEDVKRSEEIGGDYMTFEEKMIELAEIRAEEMVEERAEKLAEERVEKLVEERLKENSSNTVRQIASNMKAAGLETEQIVQICGLSLDEVELL